MRKRTTVTELLEKAIAELAKLPESQQESMLESVRKMVEEYKDEPYILMWKSWAKRRWKITTPDALRNATRTNWNEFAD